MAYLAPIHRPSSVRHAINLSFLSPTSSDLIVAKANRLEIYSPNPHQPDQLSLQYTRSLYGKVTLLHKLRPATSQTDHLFVGTDHYHYFTLSWDASTKQLRTEKSYVDIAEKSARDSQTGDRVHIDPTSRFLSLECYEGVINVLPIAHAGKGKRKAADNEIGELQDPIPVRIPELFVRSTCFVHKRQAGSKLANPELAVLWEDSTNKVRLKVRELEFTPSLRPAEEPPTAELEKGKDAQGEIELGASHLIPLPPPMYGMLVVGETRIAYVDEWEYRITDTQPLDEATIFVAWCAVDEQRYVLADDYGKLYLLFVLQNNTGEYAGHRLDILGQTSRANTLVYLDAGRIFVGSHQGDSQVIQISEQSMEVVQTFANIAPILDFTIMDMGNRSSDAPVNEFSSGQARIVTGSGAYKDGSLRSVRSGVGLEDVGSIGEMGAPVSAMFSLRSSPESHFVDTLVVGFVSYTRVFRFDVDGEVEEVDHLGGFELAAASLYAGNTSDGRIVQVTGSAVIVSHTETRTITSSWSLPDGRSITAVAAEGDSLLVSIGGAELVVLDLSNVSSERLEARTRRTFESEEQVSCIALSKAVRDVCVVGFWQESRVAFLSLHDLQPIATERVADSFDTSAVPRSVVLANILQDAPPTLFVGLADGNVVTYTVQSPQQPFTSRKSTILGTQQANFTLLPRGDGVLDNVFATCEHPSLIYGQEGRTVYSAVTAETAQSICSFDSEAYSGAIAIATEEGELKLAMVDEERTTHVQTLRVGETVRRIAYSTELKAFGLGTIKRVLRAGVEEVTSSFKLVDEVAFQELHTVALNEDELVECVMRCQLDDGSGTGETAERFVVGTAYLDDAPQQQTKGRILVLEVTEERRLKVVAELGLKGACRCLAVVLGRIVAALVKTVVIYALEYQTPSHPFLVKKAAYRTSTAPIDICVTGSTIAVTDLMKSVSLVSYKPGRGGVPDTLSEIARHYETLWGTAIANVAENTYLEADAEGNLVVLQHEVNGYSDEDRRRLRPVSEMLLGEMVNRIRSISVQPTATAVVVPRAFLATVEGSIYLFALISPGKQDLLMRLQALLAERVKSPGHVPFAKWRGFRSQVRDMGGEGPTRFVDGELVERYLEAPVEVQVDVASELGREVEELRGMVEGLRRMH
ncbi:hypothetical protein BAUCODRAFT_116696 [Baudoinia panamericana UAMH 10762]|uniref:DNA damage-binding protein 1 n=1 Tax=Baudoinia panamericana (strain UAMH 10762) TaxID=717646 RepID=M2LCN9_BAUPA|nr:uncharacterized protein BAUCODRAFT_116696 [Baudoinia panamericana UAMH 10762]EMC91732.1 hypothetical protein BAUCODRAFT_116696 [Baudoinia panamericana UAMH 10762]